MFLLKFKNTFLCFFYYFLNVFCVFFDVVSLLFLKQKVQNYKYDAFLMGKDSISWTERVFYSSIIDFI